VGDGHRTLSDRIVSSEWNVSRHRMSPGGASEHDEISNGLPAIAKWSPKATQ